MENPQLTYPEQVLRFCPRCGASPFQVRKGRSFVCPQCQFQLYINSAAAVGALIQDEKGNLLLTRRAKPPMQGALDIPGGFVDLGETAEDALRREIREELNLTLHSLQFFLSSPNQYVYGGLTYFTLDLAFECKVQDFTELKFDDEIQESIFVAPQAIDLDTIGFLSIRNIITRFIQR